MRAEPIFAAIQRVQQALRKAEAEALEAEREGRGNGQ